MKISIPILAATTFLTISCSTHVANRGPASLNELKGLSIPEDSITKLKSISFAIKENGIKLEESSSSSFEAPPSKYSLEIDGVFSGDIMAASGEYIVEYKDNDEKAQRKRPGKVKYNNMTIKKLYVGGSELEKWYKGYVSGSSERKSGSIIYLDREGQEIRINFTGAQPVRWKAPELNSKKEMHAVEELEIVVESMEIK